MSRRCFYLAQTYQANKKYREALALFEQVGAYCGDAVLDYRNLANATKFADKVHNPPLVVFRATGSSTCPATLSVSLL